MGSRLEEGLRGPSNCSRSKGDTIKYSFNEVLTVSAAPGQTGGPYERNRSITASGVKT